jgi:hypothetical protein
MTSSLDLILLPFLPSVGHSPTKFPALHVASPPRRVARGRKGDQLVLYLAFAGGNPLTSEQVNALLGRLAQIYYRTSGTVTSAQRRVAESLNQTLLERNLKGANTVGQTIAWLTQMVRRSGRVSLAQSGPTHVYILSESETRHLHDPLVSGRGLGYSQTAHIRYSQAVIQPNDALILTHEPPASWTEAALENAHDQGAENFRRRLLALANPHTSALVVQAQLGTGRLYPLAALRVPPPRPYQPHPEILEELEPDETTIDEEDTQEVHIGPLMVESWVGGVAIDHPESGQVSPVTAENAPKKVVQPVTLDRAPTPQEMPAAIPVEPLKKAAPRIDLLVPLRKLLDFIAEAVGQAVSRLARGLAFLLKQMLPDAGLFTLPAATMAFLAIAVPLVVVTVASTVYLQRGRLVQYQHHFDLALAGASRAEMQTEESELRQTWLETLAYLDQAEYYLSTSESQTLRNRARTVLDGLDYVERLDFRPALSANLKENAHISRLVVTDTDLYMLNVRDGVVLRATMTNRGYAEDPTFQCGPGPYGGYIVGAIIDIAPLPRVFEPKATLLAMDVNGNLLYCMPGESPLAAPMAPPDTNWGKPEGLAYDSGDLYILDPQTNAVWIYRGADVSRQPRYFFNQQTPPLQGVIDLAVNRDDLYLLHTDSHVTACQYSALQEAPTRCEDPAWFVDPRPGRQDGPVIRGAHFSEILFVPPPDPSIYLLEPASHAIYHFSVRLTFQRQFQPATELQPGPATAFTVSHHNRTIFLAIGNQVYYAALP